MAPDGEATIATSVWFRPIRTGQNVWSYVALLRLGLRSIYSAVHWPAKPRITIYQSGRGHARNRRQPKSGPSRWMRRAGRVLDRAVFRLHRTIGLLEGPPNEPAEIARAQAELAMAQEQFAERLQTVHAKV